MKICEVCHCCYDDAAEECRAAACAAAPLRVARGGSLEIAAAYRLNRLLAHDAFAEIYEATQTNFDQTCVIEIFRGERLAQSSAASKLLAAEASRAARLIHANTIGVLDYGALADNDFYVVTEAVKGETLREMLQKKRVLDEQTALEIVKQAAMGLHAAHKAGFVHRGVRPENIVVARDSNKRLLVKVKNFDFGSFKSAALAAAAQNSQAYCRALEYFAPEQLAGDAARLNADVYALAIVLYETLAGVTPFAAETNADLLRRQFDERPKPLRRVSHEARSILMHALALALDKNPATRTASAADFAEHLRHVEPLLARVAAAPPKIVPLAPEFRVAPKSAARRSAPLEKANPKTFAPAESSTEARGEIAAPNKDAAAPARENASSAESQIRFVSTPILIKRKPVALKRKSAAAPQNKTSQQTSRKFWINEKFAARQFAQIGVTLAVLFACALSAAFLLVPQLLRSPAERELARVAAPEENVLPSGVSSAANQKCRIDAETPETNRADAQTTIKRAAAQNGEPTTRESRIQKPLAAAEPHASGAAIVKTVDKNARAELNKSLDDWISATNSRDVNRQMNYYAENLNAFYLARNASQRAVKAEKQRVFGDATAIEMAASDPNITISADGKTAKMRFRKKYTINSIEQKRSGEVLQELHWKKSGDKWKIVGERDLKVLGR